MDVKNNKKSLELFAYIIFIGHRLFWWASKKLDEISFIVFPYLNNKYAISESLYFR